MKKGYVLALDQSTSASKAIVVNKNGDIISRASLEHKQYYPSPGWVEHDPMEIYQNVKKILNEALLKANLSPLDIDVLSITNQRETVVVWDKITGIPIYNAIVWQCRRTSDMCLEFKKKGFEELVHRKTGLLIDPYFSATKVKWILDNVKGAKEKAKSGQLLFGTIDSWLIWKLTKGKVHATDFTNASRTLLFNINTLEWDNELLKLFEIPSSMLPEIKSSNEIFGYTSKYELFDVELPISGVVGDSQGALFGQNCFEPGMVKATYGTGSSIMMNIGNELKQINSGLVTSIAWGISGSVEYAIEGIVHCTGDAIKWVKDNLGLFELFDDIEKSISSLNSNEGVYMVPAFVGLGIPYWDSNARAAIVGLSRGSCKKHIIRAALESITYQIRDAIEIMKAESGIMPKELRVDGGPTKNNFLMQYQADILNLRVVCTQNSELSSIGSVYIAGLAVGLWKDKEEIRKLRKEDKVYTPSMNDDMRDLYYNGWKTAVKRVLTY